MKRHARTLITSTVLGAALSLGSATSAIAQAPATRAPETKPPAEQKEKKMTPDGKWEVHSMTRPKPAVVAPPYDGQPVAPPEGAVVLFDGKDLSKWQSTPKKEDPDQSGAPKWKVADGYMEIVPKTGTLKTKDSIKGDIHLHIEWATPSVVVGKSQGRGNSGVFLGGYPEVQVLDSYENETYADGQAAALYGMYAPAVNACRKPGEWQSYDIIAERARVENGKVVQKARLTVKHNGVLVHDKVELEGRATEGGITLQDHSNPVRYRNIWYKPLATAEKK